MKGVDLMSIERMKSMQNQIMNCVEMQIHDLRNVNTKQLGEAIDMIKDLSEAIYYCTITDSMQKTDEQKEMRSVSNINYYTSPMWGKDWSPQSATNTGGGTMRTDGMRYYTQMPMDMQRDPREGRSYIRRRMYMEGKEHHQDTNSQLRELEAYLQELSSDITEMIQDASPEQKATLRQKMAMLSDKIA